ncbi:MAG: AMP-binding protein [Clostridia bacterium]|nr:AMP-binding protein [Clostridia bacterium]
MVYKKLYDVKKVNSIKELMQYAVEENGERDAFRYKSGKEIVSVTYNEFQKDTISLEVALNKLGVEGKHIAVIGENSYDWLTVYLSVLKSKSVLVPIDKELPLKDIINVLKHSESEVFFYSGRYEKHIREISNALPQVKYFIGFDKDEDESESNLSYKKFLNSGKEVFEKEGYEEPDIDTNAMKMIIYTSGTTGMSKGVMLTEHNLLSVAYGALRVTKIQKSCLSVLPYHHTYEAVAGIITEILNGTTICINDSLKNVARNLELFKPEHIYVVPAFAEMFYKKIWATAEKEGKAELLKKMIKVCDFLRLGNGARRKLLASVHKAFGGNLVEIVCGGAALRPEVGKFFNSIGIMFFNGYGITECSPLVSVNTPYLNDPVTVGLPLECCEVKLKDITDDGIGEICVKGDIVMLGYYKNEEKTKEVLEDGWFSTGDFGMITDKGQLVITGRKKNIIVLENGKNVYPEEIENYLVAIPYIQEVIVKPTVNEHGFNGNNLCAEVFLNAEKVQEFGDIDIKEKLKADINAVTEELPVYKKISEIEIRDTEFEKTTTNKIKR